LGLSIKKHFPSIVSSFFGIAPAENMMNVQKNEKTESIYMSDICAQHASRERIEKKNSYRCPASLSASMRKWSSNISAATGKKGLSKKCVETVECEA